MPSGAIRLARPGYGLLSDVAEARPPVALADQSRLQ